MGDKTKVTLAQSGALVLYLIMTTVHVLDFALSAGEYYQIKYSKLYQIHGL